MKRKEADSVERIIIQRNDLIRQRASLLRACKYALSFINERCPGYDQIHTRTLLEITIEKAES